MNDRPEVPEQGRLEEVRKSAQEPGRLVQERRSAQEQHMLEELKKETVLFK